MNETDEYGELALELALTSKQDTIAENLVRHQADINHINADNRTLLHLAIQRGTIKALDSSNLYVHASLGDEHSATFLIRHSCLLDHQTSVELETPLHLLSSLKAKELSTDVLLSMCRIAQLVLEYGADPNRADAQGNTCLHRAILADNMNIFRELLKVSNLSLNERNRDDHVPLWLALQQAEQMHLNLHDETFASLLVNHHASIDAIDPITEDSLLHKCARHHYQLAGLYLISQGATVNHRNRHGETALHLTSQLALEQFTSALLDHGADPNIQTMVVPSSDADETVVGLQTPVHRAVYASQERLLQIYIDRQETISDRTRQADFNLQDEHGQSVFSLALWMNMLTIAKQLLDVGHAQLDIKDTEQSPLLAQAISKQNVPAALFLLEQNVDVNEVTHELCPIQLAVQYHLPSVVEALCRHAANMNVIDTSGNSVLWNALDSGQENIATILVKFGCDSTQ